MPPFSALPGKLCAEGRQVRQYDNQELSERKLVLACDPRKLLEQPVRAIFRR